MTFAGGGAKHVLIPVRYPGTESQEDDDLRLSRKTVWQAFNEILEAAGLPRKSERFHSPRHHFVTSVLRSSGNLKAAQELARHESVLTTQRYAHLSNHEIDMVYDAAFNSPPPSIVRPEE